MCDSCGTAWHTYCIKPPLQAIPEGNFICPVCIKAGVTDEMLQQRSKILANAPPEEARLENLFKNKNGRVREAAAESLDGRLVCKTANTKEGNQETIWGVVHYRGEHSSPKYFRVEYSNGSEEIMTHAKLKKMQLMPEGTPHPNTLPQEVHDTPKVSARGRPYKNMTFS